MSAAEMQLSAGQQQQQRQEQNGSVKAKLGQWEQGSEEVLCVMDQAGTIFTPLSKEEVRDFESKFGPVRPVVAGGSNSMLVA